MSRASQPAQSPSAEFRNVSGSKPKLSSAKRQPPLSLRLTVDQRVELEKKANGMPLGTYVKCQIFGAKAVPRKRTAIQDYELLARVLSALGKTDVFTNLSAVAERIESGDLVLSAEQKEQITLACMLVMEIRRDLITALGVKVE